MPTIDKPLEQLVNYTQFAAYNAIPKKKTYILYPDFGHEALPGSSEALFEFMMGL